MSNLKYKTRGSTDPKGKPRVYFCCHFEDFKKYFDPVSNEILSKQNCTIWYTEGEFERTEDFLADLKQMQLFVMPVTSNLLCSDNNALKVEFAFAIENHIPVLPLLQESGLEQLFNKKCGDLQFLDKANLDGTAISYEEKLEKYLSSVLIGDDLAEKIRSAFDAYVFLSYRKKDRKYAQELMRLIHKNDFCRDIAIWYDEFLTPGENFNTSIEEAIKKSGLFVLTVTPNLVNETNYIMTTEYPMAKREGKTILPAEIVHTDWNKLFEQYEKLPIPTDAHDDVKLSQELLRSVKKMAINKNDNSSEHNFFIGLAYLDGIDVEIDYERALDLITSAAENRLPEAMKKLVSMYKSGKGVKIDYISALNWQYQLVNVLFERFNVENTINTFSEYFDELFNYIGDLYSERGTAPYELGASKILEDCLLFIRDLEIKKTKEIQEKFIDPYVSRQRLSNDKFMKTLIESKQKLRVMGEKFLSVTCRFYRTLLYDKNQDNTLSQAIIRYVLSYFSEFAGNTAECLKYRKEAEQIISIYAQKNDKDVGELQIQCFINLEQLPKYIDTFRR